jgi:O-acetyl-ADP-ribose deacetylase (regulator of RNase III)
MYKEINGDLIELALSGQFDAIAHQTNCFGVQGGGISKQFVKRFYTNNSDLYILESSKHKGDFNKLGQINGFTYPLASGPLIVVNLYGQYEPGANTDYIALQLCLRKLNRVCSGLKVGLPKIGCGIGGGDWDVVSSIIKSEMRDCDVTVVIYNK